LVTREKEKKQEKEAKKNYVLTNDTPIASASKVDDRHGNG